MAIVVGVQDFNDNTDVIIVVDVENRSLTWVPRDLFSFLIHNRVNVSFAQGGHTLFQKVLNNLGFYVEASIIIPRHVCEIALKNASFHIPIERLSEYYYPLVQGQPIEAGKKVIYFSPPGEYLTGERIHQFIGARYRKNKSMYEDLPDIERIQRQITFVKAMLKSNFDFYRFAHNDTTILGDINLFNQLKKVSADYHFKIYRNFQPVKINNMSVLANLTETKNIYNSIKKNNFRNIE